MNEWRYNAEQGSGELILEGDLTVVEVASIRDQILAAFGEADTVTIDITAVTTIDIAGVQLLCACHRYAAKHGQTVRLQAGGNRLLSAVVSQTGMERNFGCDPQWGEDCFWKMTETAGN